MTRSDHETETRILDAASAVFTRRGTHGARMQEIADEAGVNKALLHYYFRSKEQLARAVFARAAAGLFPRIVGILGSDLPLEAKVSAMVAHELDYLLAHPYLPGYVLAEMNQHPERGPQLVETMLARSVDDLRSQVRAVLGRQLEEAAREGRMRPVAVEEFMANLVSLCIFPFAARPMLQLLLEMDAGAFERFIEERKRNLPEFFLRGLRP